VALHQKTDIFKKLMWFAYPNAEDWIPLKVDRVKEIMAMNKKGLKPSNLKEEAFEVAPNKPVEKVLDYENVVGQDSLTRLDERPRNKNNRNNNKKQERPPRAVQQRHSNDASKRAEGKPENKRAEGGNKPDVGRSEAKSPESRRPDVKKIEGDLAAGKSAGLAAGEAAKPVVPGEKPSGNRNNRNRNNNRRRKPATDKPKDE
jgi:hypothetical protein